MDTRTPTVELDAPYGDADAPTPWASARSRAEAAEVWWLSTVRADGRPHVTPIAAVWLDDTLFFSTGPAEQKARNLAANDRVVATTGTNEFRDGLDIVIEGEAVPVDRTDLLERLVAAFDAKYQGHFGFTVDDGGMAHDEGGHADVYRIEPSKAWAYGRGAVYSATRFRF